jgi:hypothetical protein
LLAGIRDRLLIPDALDYSLTELRHGLEAHEEQEQATELFRKRTELEKELDRIGDAIAQNGGSKFLLHTLNKKESELESVNRTIAKLSRSKISGDAKWLRKRLAQEVMALPTLLNLEPERAKAHLLRHISEIRMTPHEEDGKKFYVAEGEWVIGENENVTGAQLDGDVRIPQSVAGAYNAPKPPELPFRYYLPTTKHNNGATG